MYIEKISSAVAVRGLESGSKKRGGYGAISFQPIGWLGSWVSQSATQNGGGVYSTVRWCLSYIETGEFCWGQKIQGTKLNQSLPFPQSFL